MSNLLAQIVLAQRSPDGGWMNILVVVVMAVIWIVGGIVKATKTKSGDKRQPSRAASHKLPANSRGVQQQMPGRVAQRPAGLAQRPQQLSGAQKKRTMLADLRAAARKFAAEAEQAFQVQTTKPAPPEPAPKAQIPPKTAPRIEPVIAPVKRLGDKQTAAAQMAPPQHLSDLLSDYADRDKLRKAIMHFEILGPPLSLRD
ncbi:MAG: hypothetical protein ISS70_19340 [Phycisphaerae bacterium]|nr:hypothetical protein [Phycisphaerae bacterium]